MGGLAEGAYVNIDAHSPTCTTNGHIIPLHITWEHHDTRPQPPHAPVPLPASSGGTSFTQIMRQKLVLPTPLSPSTMTRTWSHALLIVALRG